MITSDSSHIWLRMTVEFIEFLALIPCLIHTSDRCAHLYNTKCHWKKDKNKAVFGSFIIEAFPFKFVMLYFSSNEINSVRELKWQNIGILSGHDHNISTCFHVCPTTVVACIVVSCCWSSNDVYHFKNYKWIHSNSTHLHVNSYKGYHLINQPIMKLWV